MTPTPHIAIAWPCFSLGYELSSTACDSGTSEAPNRPWIRRNITISGKVWARPHRTEAPVKPATAIRNSRLRPSRASRKPVTGVAMAAATIYDVSTQLIWSTVADSEPCM